MFKLNLEISGTGRNSVSEISLENDVFSLGSGPANGPGFVILPSLGGIVSRVHATLFKDGKSWFIRDGNGKPSKNGVWLNFHGWVTEPVRLEPGQVFVLAENSTGAIRLKTQPIETTKPGISPYGDSESPPTAVSPSGGKKMVSAVQVDLEKTELLPPVTLSVVLSRIDKIERYLVKSQNHLNAQSIKGHKGAALICA
ncbi:MAG: FHA domain-containing protein, partial [Endozoicomonas sp.]